MTSARRATLRPLAAAAAFAALAGCTTESFDWDLRPQGQGSTAQAALAATRDRPAPDARGVLSYPGYQVALARRGDTVASVAARVGLDPAELARANALRPEDPLREGEILALPRRVTEPAPGSAGSGFPPSGSVIGGGGAGGAIDVTTLAGAAIDRAAPATGGSAATTRPAPAGPEPIRHRVVRGETAFSVARLYGVSPRALADWNGLGPDLSLREGQTLLIPTAAGSAPPPAPVETAPGAGSATPVPPSAAKPLPAETPAPAAAKPAGVPASPDLGEQRTGGTAMAMPVQGKIIRSYAKGKNDGIDIAAAPGTAVVAAADGTVAAITKDTGQVPILVLRHAGNLLTVYAGIDGVSLAKGAAVKRGQKIAVIRQADPAFLHFEVRKGVESVDPLDYLQ